MENGELELWDPAAILDNKSAAEALILRNATHSGTLCALDFNLFQTNLLASAGSNSEVYIWDLKNPSTPYSPGARSSKMDDISSVAWNCQVPHILSTASTNGYTVVWDLRNKKEVMTLAQGSHSTLTGGRGSISSISWHPNVAFQIIAASDDDQNPIISLWDLRHAHSPEKILTGHTMGVLDVSWCRQDSDLLISSGKDCKTLCWNPNTGKLNGELSSNLKWSFGVDWSPRNPDLFATSSFDGSIDIFSIQGTLGNNPANRSPVSGDPFDTSISAAAASSTKSFELTVPPKWLRRPVGATFGFGGKLVTFNNKLGQRDTASGTPGQPTGADWKATPRFVKITTIHTDPDIVKRSEELESATYNNLSNLIDDRIQNSSKDKVEWEVLKTLFSEDAREQLITYLGFEKEQVTTAAAALLESCDAVNESKETLKSDLSKQIPINLDRKDDPLTTPTNTAAAFFAESSFLEKTNDSFFSQLSQENDPVVVGGRDSGLASAHVVSASKPFKLYPEGSTENDHLITRAIMIGDFESAVKACIAIERFSDALMLAICGGSDLLAQTQKIYFESQSKKHTYLRLLEGIVEDDLSSIVRDADVKEWASILVVLCTYAQPTEFGSYCELMGDRLLSDSDLHDKAILFYLASGNLEKVSSMWISQFEQDKCAGESAVHGIKLQELVEKVTIFRTAIDYEDTFSASECGEYPLSDLYDKYCEYAEFMASQGRLDVAMKYINLTPSEYNSTKAVRRTPSSIMRDRIFHASTNKLGIYKKPSFPFEQKLLSSKGNVASAAVNSYSRNHAVYQPTTSNLPIPASIMQPTTNYYAPSVPTTPQQQYTPYNYNGQELPADNPTNFSTAGNYRQPQKTQDQSYDNGPKNYTGAQNSSAIPPPPPKGTGAWNDPPMLASPQKAKKYDAPSGLNATSVTTAMPVKKVTSPFANSPVPQNQQVQPPPPPPPMLARGLGGPPPPPPSSSTTIGGYYSAHQQPQQFQPQQQQFKAAPPPKNAIAPSPMNRESSSHQRH
ncbi:unnamed protein product [Mucor hiemalis]